MPVIRLVAIALVALSISAFAQESQPNIKHLGGSIRFVPQTYATASEPWRILPDDSSSAFSSKTPLNQLGGQSQLRNDGQNLVPNPILNSTNRGFAIPGDGHAPDGTCFAIRSYVMARDRKDSDLTYLVHYSTCQPASKYRLKTIELQSQPANR